ncbi:uncharacterized protein LOC120895484 [Anopheles arabiensis]|uniref:uncharacterized protein LOC120895484 n=1 Tax=Anopheles arabiensis TaxID=7173 RepID=UPI001AADFFEA|nr:uncharacterized protein LOC120895484 [Anopheles arabiensis]
MISKTALLLLAFIPLSAGWFTMFDSTCDMIKSQLQLIDDTVTNTARIIVPTQSFYFNCETNCKLQKLLKEYEQILTVQRQYHNQMTSFVQSKRKQFGVPAEGLQDNAAQLEKVFRVVNDRNTFHQRQVDEQKLQNQNVTAELAEPLKLLQQEQRRNQLLQAKLVELSTTISQMETENKKLQAKINDNPTSVQG